MQIKKVIAYASRQLKIHENYYTSHNLELRAVVFSMRIWRHYLYGTECIIFTDPKSLQHIFDKKELNMRQRRWIELLNDYECDIRYHPWKENVAVDAFSHNERAKPRRVKSLTMTNHSNLNTQIHEAQLEALKEESVGEEALQGMDKNFKLKDDETRYFMNMIWTPRFGDIRRLVLDESYRSRYSAHPRSNNMYLDMKKLYWWPNMKAEITAYM